MKKHAIHKEFEKIFGDKLYSKKFDYHITVQDLYQIAEIFNKYIFNSTLNIDDIEIVCVEFKNQTNKGSSGFGKYKKPSAKFLIQIVKYMSGDNFYQIVNVLAHELIHIYDIINGKILELLKKHSNEILSGFYVTNYNGNQYVGDDKYDAHGKFFKKIAEKINKLGFDVQQKYNIKNRSYMKKLSEKDNKEVFFNETDESKEALTYKALKQVFDSIIAPDKRFVYRNAKEWFIEFP